jgi:glycosyltransferase involved in cell wall biosynthesis
VREANAGPAAARNHGLSLAQGEFVAFQDADDVWHPEKLARQMARLAARPELDLCVTHVQNFWVPELWEEAKQFRHHRFSQPLPGYAIPTLLARRALFGTVGRFNTALRLSYDTDWFLRAAEQGAVMELLPDVLMYRRLHQANISKQPGTPYMNSALPNDLLKMVKASLDRRRQSGGPPEPYEFSRMEPDGAINRERLLARGVKSGGNSMVTGSLVSCTIAVYNGERYVQEAIDSILAQTYRPIEIIVVDDGSTDRTAEVVARYGDQVRFLTRATAGPAATRNLGLSAAQGELVAFLDADDWWHPEKLSRQIACFKTQPELGFCVTHAQNVWIPELQEEATRFQHHRLSRAIPGYYASTLLARRVLFKTVGLFNTVLWHEDVKDWFLRAAEQGTVMALLPDILVYHRMHQGNLSRRRAAAARSECLQLLKASLDRRRCRDGPIPRPYLFPTADSPENT